MSDESSSGGCGCCGCLFMIIGLMFLLSAISGNLTINGTTWDLDIFPPGLNSVEAEKSGEVLIPEKAPNDAPDKEKEW